MSHKTHFLTQAVVLMISIAVSVGLTIAILYSTALEEEHNRLQDVVQSQARLIEAVARYDQLEDKKLNRTVEESFQKTLAQLKDAHANYIGFAQTGEFTLAKKEKNQIRFLLTHRHTGQKNPRIISWKSDVAEPMRLALQNQSGTIIGKDYRGEVVLAAYEPVKELNLGIVAKIDLFEVQEPFIYAGLIVLLISILVVILVVVILNRLSGYLFKELEDQSIALMKANITLEKMEEIAMVGAWEYNFQTGTPYLSKGSKKIYNVIETPPIEDGVNFYAPESRPLIEKAFESLIQEKKPYDLEANFIPKNSEPIVIHAIGESEIVDGQVVGAIGIIQDITKFKKIEEELRHSREKAIFANQAKSNFLTMMSHDLRAPMNGILGMAQLLKFSNLNEEQQQYCDIILNSGDALIVLLSDILDLSKIEAGRQILKHESFNIIEIVESTAALFSGSARVKGISVTYDIDSRIHTNLLGDQNLLERILSNLIGNAVKFTEEGIINVCLKLSEETEQQQVIYFEISDTGIGLLEEHQKHIFDPFSQVDDISKNTQRGSGLGLSIVKQLVELMGGEITLQSTINEGSRFSFTLKFDYKNREAQQETDYLSHLREKDNSLTLVALIVEDDPVSQQVICQMLKLLNIKAEVVSNGKDVIPLIQTQSYDLIFMDLLMPVMDGYETTKKIRNSNQSLNKNTPIIAITAMTSMQNKELCFTVGMNEYLLKPIKFDELAKIVQNYRLDH